MASSKMGPKAPLSTLDFLSTALFLEDPETPKEKRIGRLRFLSVVFALLTYTSAIFVLILAACITTQLFPLQSAFSTLLHALTPPKARFSQAYEFQGSPVARLSRFISSRIGSSFRRSASRVASDVALHRFASGATPTA